MDKKIILAVFVVIINIISFSLMGIDKKKAQKSKWRIKESTLLWWAFCLGGTGSFLGMQIFRHKTKHKKFIIFVPMCVIINIIVIILIYKFVF